MLASGDLDFSFSGLKTAVLLAARDADPAAYPDIARAAALAVPGWRPELIIVDRVDSVDEPRERCENCLTLTWKAREKRYE